MIFWEYAKLIAGSAVGRRDDWKFVVKMWNKLRWGYIHPSSVLIENKKLVEVPNECAYCGSTDELQWEHIIPKSRGGPDTIDNLVRACRACNGSGTLSDHATTSSTRAVYRFARCDQKRGRRSLW